MYCTNCGKKLEEGEICLCKSFNKDQKSPSENSHEQELMHASLQPQKPDKKKPSWKKILIGIIAGVVAFTLCSFIFPVIFEKIFEDNSPESSQTDIFEGIEGDFVIASTDTDYTKGTVKDNVYTNPWANLKVTFDGRFAEGTQEDYEAYESLLYDCGAYFYADDDGDDIGIIFYDAGSTTVMEYADECIEIWEQSAEKFFKETYSESFLQNVTYNKDARVVEIAGEEYLGVFLTAKVYEETFIVYCDFCAMKDGRIIDISITADSVEECINLVQSFETCNGYDF